MFFFRMYIKDVQRGSFAFNYHHYDIAQDVAVLEQEIIDLTETVHQVLRQRKGRLHFFYDIFTM